MATKLTATVSSIVIFIISFGLSIFLYSKTPDAFPWIAPWVIQLVRASAMLIALFLLFERLFKMELHTKIILGMLLGAAAGILFKNNIMELKPVGTAFIRLIQMIVVPLVFASLLAGTASLGDIGKMKRIGTKTLLYYLASTAFAITVGLVLANIFHPGSGMSPEVQAKLMENYQGVAGQKLSAAQQTETSPVQTFLNIIPQNPFEALTGASMLQIIFFSIVTGIALTLIPKEKAQPVIAFFDGLFEAMIKIVVQVIKIAPYGVFALIADAVGNFGLEILASLLKYTLVTTAGLLLVIFLYPFVQSIFSGLNPG
ncbi:MAG: dicarboxylate/amino acid:cation symporter, partial [Calditrichaeota bacterium]